MFARHIRPPSRGILTSLSRAVERLSPSSDLFTAFAYLSLSSTRQASHKSQGSTNSAKDGPGKRLGAKKTGGQLVLSNQIIYRQRGTLWHAGENAGLGRDHTIFAQENGYVRYYKDPQKHATRRYIGVALTPEQSLPTLPHIARRRRLGFEAFQMPAEAEEVGEDGAAAGDGSVMIKKKGKPDVKLTLGKGYMYRESNWEIGRAAERAGVKFKAFVPNDRFRAWRKRTARVKRSAARKVMKARK